MIESTTGDMYLSGRLYENREIVFFIPPNSFKIKKGSGEIMAFVTSTSYTDAQVEILSPHIVPAGSLILDGKVVTSEVPN